MNNYYIYPYCKVFYDTDNEVHIISHASQKSHGHKHCKHIGLGLIDFVTLDLIDYDNKITEVSSTIEATSANFFSIHYDRLKNDIFDIADILKGKHDYLHFFLLGKLNNIFTDNSICDSEQILLCLDEINALLTLKQRFTFAVNLCLDVENNPSYTMAEKFVAFVTAFPKYANFTFKSAFAVSPTYKGKLDFEKVKQINKKEIGTKEQLKLIHADNKGVSLASYTLIETLEEMLYFEFTELLKQGLQIKKCKLCSKYFVLTSKHEADFCDRLYKNKRTCKQHGAKQVYNERVAADPVLQEYQRIYKRYFARGEMPFEKYPQSKFCGLSFREWSDIASDLRKQYLAGQVSGAGLVDGIDE